MPPRYTPIPLLAGGHRMTIYAWARPRRLPGLPPAEVRHFDVAPGARVMAHCNWQAERRAHPTLVAMHGLEGSSEAHYMRGLADKAWRAGFNVVRLNQRNCGGTEHLSRGLYSSALSGDPRAVVENLVRTEGLDRFGVAGYSMGGNLALKLAGEIGARDLPEVKAVAAVSPVIDLERSVRAIERRANRIYEWNFCRSLQARMRRKDRAFPGAFDLRGLWRVWSIRAFDNRYTAPHHGFPDAATYYDRASALRVIHQVARPTFILSAADDPFVPPEMFREAAVAANPHIETLITPHGGHCAFVETPDGDDGYFAERAVVAFLSRHLRAAAPASAGPAPLPSPRLRA